MLCFSSFLPLPSDCLSALLRGAGHLEKILWGVLGRTHGYMDQGAFFPEAGL